jgi:hypothetical protein
MKDEESLSGSSMPVGSLMQLAVLRGARAPGGFGQHWRYPRYGKTRGV